jgi:Fic family protein
VVVAPSIPIPVKKVPKRPTLEQRAKRLDKRISKQTAEFRNQYAENFDMSWIYHDTALEGVVYTFEELSTAFRSDEVTVVDSSVMPIFDSIRRQKEAIEFVRDAAEKKKAPASVDLLKKIYVILHPEEGDVKTVKYRRDIPQHRTYFHEYAQPDRIAYRVRQTVDWVNDPENKKNVGTLRMAAKAHYDLARTYPFTNDSGKVARLFMNFLIMRAGLPPAIIHATERQRYYEALKNNNASALLKMLRDSVANALSSIEKLLDEHETKKRGFVS